MPHRSSFWLEVTRQARPLDPSTFRVPAPRSLARFRARQGFDLMGWFKRARGGVSVIDAPRGASESVELDSKKRSSSGSGDWRLMGPPIGSALMITRKPNNK